MCKGLESVNKKGSMENGLGHMIFFIMITSQKNIFTRCIYTDVLELQSLIMLVLMYFRCGY